MKQTDPIIKTIPLVLIIMFTWLSFENVAMTSFNKYILPLSANISYNIFAYIPFALLFLLFVYILVKQGKKPSTQRISLCFLFIGIYSYYRGFKGYISLPDNCLLGYSDALVILLFVYATANLFKYCCKTTANCINKWVVFLVRIMNSTLIKLFSNRLLSNNQHPAEELNIPQTTPFIVDRPIEKPEDDILYYSSSIKSLKDSICDIGNQRTSFSVGILAPWGRGKTSYMNLLALELGRDDDNIIINFNPRHSKDK